MIFVTLGTQKFQLNRLLRTLDECVQSGLIRDEIIAQTGHSDYTPKHYQCHHLLGRDEFEAHMRKADIVISHSGVGSIITALNYKKPVIVFPRLVKYREHVDDHQVEIARLFAEKGYVLYCGETDDLPTLVEKAKTHSFNTYISQTDRFVDLIDDFLQHNIK